MTQAAYDVVVAGWGCAGAMAAIAAADAGARVLLVEKCAHIGGTSMLSSGFARVASDAAGAAEYLDRTSGGRIERPLVEALARGMSETPQLLRDLGARAGARVSVRFGAEQAHNETEDLYDWPGRDSLGWAGIESVPGFEHFPWVKGGSKGQLLIRALQANIEQRAIDVWMSSPARSLLQRRSSHGGNEVSGLVVERDGKDINVEARGGVVLATGGFEFNRRMIQDFMEIPVLLPMGHSGNTGDGISMSVEAGAALWHMWHVHGSYGYRVPGLPVAVRNPLGGARNPSRVLAWVLVDRHGMRFTNELPRAPQDTMARSFATLNEETGMHERIPAWMVFDEGARKLGPIGRPVSSQQEHEYEWSRDNAKEVASGIIKEAPTIAALAEKMKVPVTTLVESIAAWNRAVAQGADESFGRPPRSMAAIVEPPFHAIEVWPVVSNTQGGPVHDERQRVLDTRGRPIEGLYAAGELGSFFGHIYLLGGNITEGIAGGSVAGREVAARARQSVAGAVT